MKSILLSIKPKYVELIASGKKTIEVRKSRPKLETPFKCYIYMTKGEKINGGWDCAVINEYGDMNYCGQKVIGEFVCDKLYFYEPTRAWYYYGKEIHYLNATLEDTCVPYDEIEKYGKGKVLVGWHISDLKIYDKPKELSEFNTICETYKNGSVLDELEKCCECEKALFDEDGAFYDCDRSMTRAPQSWCYCEEIK